MSQRDTILNKLRNVPSVAVHPPVISERLDVVSHQPDDLLSLFIAEAQKLKAVVTVVQSEQDAITAILNTAGETQEYIGWDAKHIPIQGLHEALQKNGVKMLEPNTDTTLGITGADAAIAATGSLVLLSGAGKPRKASLTTYKHIGVIHESQIVFNLEAWFKQQQEKGLDSFRNTANVVVISGASRTADIAMELVLGAHGPAELQIVIVAT